VGGRRPRGQGQSPRTAAVLHANPDGRAPAGELAVTDGVASGYEGKRPPTPPSWPIGSPARSCARSSHLCWDEFREETVRALLGFVARDPLHTSTR
jgi:hypothetical protein